MRRILSAVKAVLIVLAAALCAVFSLLLVHSPVFERGEHYELYTKASSSSPVRAVGDPVWEKLLAGAVAGESVRYQGDRYEELVKKFHAELLFTEEASGVKNYYLYSPLLRGGVALGDRLVNLHIAVGEEQTAAGTPLIFGGF